jgi:hypothetical protein
MYRKPAPRPWDASAITRWKRAIVARRRSLVIYRWGALWLLGVGAMAAGALAFAAYMPRSLELVCARPLGGGEASCGLERGYLGGRRSSEPVEVSAHADPLLSDDSPPGPYLLIQTPTGPHWFNHARSFEIQRAVTTFLHRDPAAPPVREQLDVGHASDAGLAFGAALALGTLLMAMTRARLIANVDGGTLTVRWGLPWRSSQQMQLEEVGKITIAPVGGESNFHELRFGPPGRRVTITAFEAACRRGHSFLAKHRAESKRRREVEDKTLT